MRSASKRSIYCLAILALMQPAWAHHGTAPHFDMINAVEFSGVIVGFNARNPHSFLTVASTDSNGAPETWHCEFNGIAMLVRAGIDENTFKPGEPIRVEAYPGRRDKTECYFLAAQLSDGRTVRVAPTPLPQANTTVVAAGNTVFGTWVSTTLSLPAPATTAPAATANREPSIYESLTPAGREALKGYDAFRDDPARKCSPLGPVRAWGTPNNPSEVVNQGKRIVIRHEFMDVERVIDMTTRTHPANGPRTIMGHSVGWFEGDTLVIDTANFLPGINVQYAQDAAGNYTGIMRSDAYHLVERLSIDPGTGNLQILFTQEDPKFLTRTLTTSRRYVRRSDIKLSRFNCEPDKA
jgi:Family of unknown function (DUF6152)